MAVVGASGFIGTSVVHACRQLSLDVAEVKAPRLLWRHPKGSSVTKILEEEENSLRELFSAIEGHDVVINTAGISDSMSRDPASLLAANALTPLAIARACQMMRIPRFIHVSTAAVQGDKRRLDSSRQQKPLSPYAKSKALGERLLLAEADSDLQQVIFRPPSVHAAGRRVTDSIQRLGSLGLLTVVDGGQGPAPHALLYNVADAIAFLATSQSCPPEIVHYPWEGLTARDFITSLTGRSPRSIPGGLASPTLWMVRTLEKAVPSFAPHRRRLEVLWLGQEISSSWLEQAGWKPVKDRSTWASLRHG